MSTPLTVAFLYLSMHTSSLCCRLGILLAEFVIGLILLEQQHPEHHLNLPLDKLSSILVLLNKVAGQLPEQFVEKEIMSWPGVFGKRISLPLLFIIATLPPQ